MRRLEHSLIVIWNMILNLHDAGDNSRWELIFASEFSQTKVVIENSTRAWVSEREIFWIFLYWLARWIESTDARAMRIFILWPKLSQSKISPKISKTIHSIRLIWYQGCGWHQVKIADQKQNSLTKFSSESQKLVINSLTYYAASIANLRFKMSMNFNPTSHVKILLQIFTDKHLIVERGVTRILSGIF